MILTFFSSFLPFCQEAKFSFSCAVSLLLCQLIRWSIQSRFSSRSTPKSQGHHWFYTVIKPLSKLCILLSLAGTLLRKSRALLDTTGFRVLVQYWLAQGMIHYLIQIKMLWIKKNKNKNTNWSWRRDSYLNCLLEESGLYRWPTRYLLWKILTLHLMSSTNLFPSLISQIPILTLLFLLCLPTLDISFFSLLQSTLATTS